MARIIFHKQKPSDKLGVCLVRFAFRFKAARERYNFKFKYFFTNTLSKNYRYGRKITYSFIDVGGAKSETVYYADQKPEFALIHLHGGAYVSGYNDSYRKVAKKYLMTNKKLKIYSLCYSLAPENPFPIALHEAVELYKHLLGSGFSEKKIIVAGDSAGGGLALALGQILKDKKIVLPKAIITMSAWTDFAEEGESYIKNKEKDPFFGKGTVPLDKEAYAQGHDYRNPYISPKYGCYDDFSDLLMFVGSHELIESDTIDLASKVENAIVHNFEGMFHVFPLGLRKMASSRAAWRIIDDFINKQFRS